MSMTTEFAAPDFTVSEPTSLSREENEVIYFRVISDNTTGEDWITRLQGNGFHIGDHAKQVLLSPDFKSTSGVTTEVAVIKGVFFEDDDRIIKKICDEADKRKFGKSNAELACLIREKFTNQEFQAMGLRYIVARHEPINGSVGDSYLLYVDRRGKGRFLCNYDGKLDCRCSPDIGLAFTVSQSSF